MKLRKMLWNIIYKKQEENRELKNEIVILVEMQTGRRYHECRKALNESNWNSIQALVMLNTPRAP